MEIFGPNPRKPGNADSVRRIDSINICTKNVQTNCMALDRWSMMIIAQEEAAKALQQYKIDDRIKAAIETELQTKIKQEIDSQFADMRTAVKIINEQIIILKDAVEILSKKYNK
jgi:hypothetical protein